MKTLFSLSILAILFSLTGCVSPPPPYDWSAFENAKPKSILVVPVLNKSVDVDAPLYALSTLSQPLGEQGYYVFPINTVKTTLEHEGLYEGEAIKAIGSDTLTKWFGADSILFVQINQWEANYAVLSTTVTVAIEYSLQDKFGNVIWTEQVKQQYQPQQQNSSGNPLADLIAAAIVAGITRAEPNYMPLMHQANTQAMVLGHRALPHGPYRIKK